MRIVIIGAGEVGRHLARSLQNEAELILVDASAKVLAEAEEGLDALTLVGDGTHR
ncbi:MAG: NAD-binding protein, partial [Myxococcales bacterium]|nr:NAD-binding protein [Myxococcales bacterium]